jgi:hypothetical protein
VIVRSVMASQLKKLLWALVVSVSLPAAAQPTASEFRDWADRFTADLTLAESTAPDESAMFAKSQWSAGLSVNFLKQRHAQGELFPKPRNLRVWSIGEALRALTKGPAFAGPGGSHNGAELHARLPSESLEVIYVRPLAEPRDRLENALKQRFGVAQLRVPPAGVLRRNEYPFLLFKRIDGKLYLAAFSKEFMTVMDAIFTLQIAEAKSRPSELALASC